jgi:hypothetical protein
MQVLMILRYIARRILRLHVMLHFHHLQDHQVAMEARPCRSKVRFLA